MSLITVVRSKVGEELEVPGGVLKPWAFVELKEVSDSDKDKLAELVRDGKVDVSQVQMPDMEDGGENRMTDEQMGLAPQGGNLSTKPTKEIIEANEKKPDSVTESSKPNLVTPGEEGKANEPKPMGNNAPTHIPSPEEQGRTPSGMALGATPHSGVISPASK